MSPQNTDCRERSAQITTDRSRAGGEARNGQECHPTIQRGFLRADREAGAAGACAWVIFPEGFNADKALD